MNNDDLSSLYDILMIGNLKAFVEYNSKNYNKGIEFSIVIEELVETLRENNFTVIYGDSLKDQIVELYKKLLGDKYIVVLAADLGCTIVLDLKKKIYVH